MNDIILNNNENEPKEKGCILGFEKNEDGFWYVEKTGDLYCCDDSDREIGQSASKLCEHLSKNGKVAAVGIVINPRPSLKTDNWCRLEKKDSSIYGAIYRVVNVEGFTGDILLGPTTLLILGEYPNTIYFVNAYGG
jgi:hypothetical protein